ncbi:MAG: serine/threonine-protein kinase [Bryobacteraceae bacterium]
MTVVQLERFGKYEIIRKLGRSMTDVYLALDTSLNRRAVLKLVEHSKDAYTQLVIEAERRGAQIQKQLHEADPRILEVYDFGEEDGCFFVAMEYFDGKNIAELLQKERRFDARKAAAYAAEACSQLGRLHAFVVSEADGQRRAVVHGDIKPSNIQVGPNGEIRLLDFGIAKVITYTHNLTHHNLGSPTYCSPERLARAQVDAQSDIWAMGVSLYEMVAGAPPYQAQNTRRLENLIQSRRSPRALPDTCPIPLRAIISKALAADLDRRYASALAFEADLRAFLDGRPTVAEGAPAWEANETIRKSPLEAAVLRKAIDRLGEIKPRNPFHSLRLGGAGVLWALLAGLVIGALILMPALYLYRFHEASRPLRDTADYTSRSGPEIEASWNLYAHLVRQYNYLGRFSPASSLTPVMRARLLATADEVIDGYRNSSNPSLRDFHWNKARQCLAHVLQITPGDREARAKLALSDGYLNLIQNPKLPKAAGSEASFRLAASLLPRSPDPHLGLAYLYTYTFRSVGRALGEFADAERWGYRSGPREQEQKGDGYLFRAQYALRQAQRAVKGSKDEEQRWLRQARADIERARNLYEPLSGFSAVNVSLEQLDRDSGTQQQLQEALTKAMQKAKPAVRRKQYRSSTVWR